MPKIATNNGMNKLTYILFFGLPFILSNCKEETGTNIPEVQVNISINLTRAEYAKISSSGSSMVLPSSTNLFEKGYAGIIVYNLNQNEFLAFDRCCTHNPGEKHALNADGALAICPVCASEFILADGTGSPVKGPAKYILRRYRTILNYPELRIVNY